ncbi:MAG: hypothetical protein Q7N50_14925 [Armatimonadota bacterium]|nr:hypothetical protein [Armatimonadota bacterium]
MLISDSLYKNKSEVLAYFRSRAEESIQEDIITYGIAQYKQRASLANKAAQETRDLLVLNLIQAAKRDHWSNEATQNNLLMLYYCANVVMLESRHSIWPYEYMTFSRRIGEIWEPFCKLCFEYPVAGDVNLYVPPLFEDVRRRLLRDIRDYISQLSITNEEKMQLVGYYDKVWSLVTSGEIKLELDLHFEKAGVRYAIDMKSGFSSNEKGNTNRLLLVGSVYKNLEKEDYRCLIFVRSEEESNNHYLQTLKKSGIWEVYCCAEAYDKISEFSGFDLRKWIDSYVNWASDLNADTADDFKQQDLMKYLEW